MNKVIQIVLSLCLLLTIPAFASWGSDIMSIDAIKHWRMDDRIAHVRGMIVETLGSDGFRMSDDTGEIRVRFANHELREFRFSPGMRVEVRGMVVHDHHSWDLEATAIKLHDDAVIGHY